MSRNFRLSVALDIDDLLVECTAYAIRLANEKYKYDPPISIYEAKSWGKTGERIDVIHEFFADPDFYRTQPVIKGAKEFVKKLSQVDYQKISEIILEELKNDVLDSKSIVLNFTENIINFIAEKSYSQKSGARDIQKNIRKEIEDKICEIIIKNNNKIIKEIFFDVDNNTVIYNFN